jgi:hypothetical protein
VAQSSATIDAIVMRDERPAVVGCLVALLMDLSGEPVPPSVDAFFCLGTECCCLRCLPFHVSSFNLRRVVDFVMARMHFVHLLKHRRFPLTGTNECFFPFISLPNFRPV